MIANILNFGPLSNSFKMPIKHKEDKLYYCEFSQALNKVAA